MTNFIQKARTGRKAALAGRNVDFTKVTQEPKSAVSFRSTRRAVPVAFISKRPQVNTGVWLH
ncbi:MAG: hypothetical protein KUG58_08790 [Marinosulfonomonas sp.]|nr:hypothetical protein [Marinosulfonomonas sp.]